MNINILRREQAFTDVLFSLNVGVWKDIHISFSVGKKISKKEFLKNLEKRGEICMIEEKMNLKEKDDHHELLFDFWKWCRKEHPETTVEYAEYFLKKAFDVEEVEKPRRGPSN